MGGTGIGGRDGRQGWARRRGGWQGRAFRDSVRHRRHGSSGAPALTRPRAVALLEGALEGSLLVPAPRQQPYLDGSRLGGGARRRQRMAQQQRSAALGLEPIGERGAQPAGHHVRAEGDLPLPAADEQRLAIVPVRSNAAKMSTRKASGSKATASRWDQRCWALTGPSSRVRRAAPSLQIQPHELMWSPDMASPRRPL